MAATQAVLGFLSMLLSIWMPVDSLTGNFLAYECYGNVLSLSCRTGHKIKVIDDFFGYSNRPFGEGQCRYKKGDCTVTNGRFTSVIHRYCEGKQTCTTFQVDRRFCGTNQTNYEQVEYQCVPDSEVTNFCQEASYSAREGYLSTPNFPNEYPPDKHCMCSLISSNPDARIRLEAAHFIVKFDHPCQDWLEVQVGSHRKRLCGAYRSTLRSYAFNLTFHSNDKDGHQGIWLHFSVHPRDVNASIHVDCRNHRWPTTTATTTDTILTTTPEWLTSTISTTDLPPSTTTILQENPSPYYGFTSDEEAITNSEESYYYQDEDPSETEDGEKGKDGEGGMYADHEATEGDNERVPNHHLQASRLPEISSAFSPVLAAAVLSETTAETDSHKQPWEWSATDSTSPTPGYYLPEPNNLPTTTTTTTASTTSLPNIDFLEPKAKGSPGISAGGFDLSFPSSSSTAPKASETVETQATDKKMADMKKVAESKNAIRRKNNRITGIIIISICVGGIILLIVILSILLCINKRRQPKRQAEKERKKRLQQRLNSLSFYDSIPLYDSIGRKAGTSVVGQSNPASSATPESQNGDIRISPSVEPKAEHTPQILDPTSLSWGDKPKDAAPTQGWTASSGIESDHDSAIYAEIDKNNEAQKTTTTPAVPPRTVPNGEGPPGYSLHLAAMDKSEDIYTHV